MSRSRPPSLDDLRARFAPPAHGALDAKGTTDPAATPFVDDEGEARAERDRGPFGERLLDLQRRLWAERRSSLLVVLQAMDAGGKDGAARNVFSRLEPRALHVSSFGPPTPAERAHDFLWRVHPHAPAAGEIAVWNRSHYEDLVVPRVAGTLDAGAMRARAAHVVAFESLLADAGTRVVKVFLHVSRAEQRRRLQARVDDPARRWKFDPADLVARAHWDEHMHAWADAMRATSTDSAPWYVVPADYKWYRDWAVAAIACAELEAADPRWPDVAWDPAAIRID